MYGLCVAFDFPGRFYDDASTIAYDGLAFDVINGAAGETHSIRTIFSQEAHYKNAFRSANHFLNELSWYERLPIIVACCIHGTGSPRCSDVSTMMRNDTCFIHAFRQKVSDEGAHLALGFFREGYAANSPFYRFLSYFKVIEQAYPKGRDREAWVSRQIPQLEKSKDSLRRLEREGVRDIGQWLYEEGRNALAHASGRNMQTIRDISDYDHWQDIVWASEIVEEMATHLIVSDFGVADAAA